MSEKKKSFNTEEFQQQLMDHVRKHGGTTAVGGEDFINKIIKSTYEALLQTEMEEHLGYAKNASEGRGNGNSRNGLNTKQVRGDFGEVPIQTPRDRDGSFEPQVIKKRQKEVRGFTDKVISLYSRGMTTREIEEHLKEMYEIDVSATFISKATERVMEEVTAWQSRTLEKLYTVVYMDGLRMNVRHEGRIIKKVVYIALGVPVSGRQEVLGLWLAETEGAHFWLNVCNELKSRGVEDILIACVDGLKGLPEAIESVFPGVDVQLCIVHQIRNSTKFLAFKDRKAFCKDLKDIYGATTIEAAEQALRNVDEKWGNKYPASIASWKNNWERLTAFFRYPVELRKIVYTTNSIESLNSQLRKNTRNRKVFPNDESVIKILYLNIRNISKKWRFRQNWDIVINQLAILFEDRLKLDALGE